MDVKFSFRSHYCATYLSLVPIFPFNSWSDYIKNHDYQELPNLFGFKPLVDSKTGNVKTSPMMSDKYGINIPIVLKCENTEGCKNYQIIANTSFVGIMYGNKNGFLFLETNSLNTIVIPSDSEGHKGITVDITAKYPFHSKIGEICETDFMCYGGYSENDGKDLNRFSISTPYKGVMAILYLDKNKLIRSTPMNVKGPFSFEEWKNKHKTFSFNFTELRIEDEPYLVHGYVWRLIDYGFTAPKTEWKRSETFSTGITDETMINLSLEIGMQVGYSNQVIGLSGALSSKMSSSWGKKWSHSTSHVIQTDMTCSNIYGYSQVVCGVYQRYGSTKLVVPGISNHNKYFELFNNDDKIRNNWFSLHLGMLETENITDDTGESLGAIYPTAGTLDLEGNLSIAQPTIELPESFI